MACPLGWGRVVRDCDCAAQSLALLLDSWSECRTRHKGQDRVVLRRETSTGAAGSGGSQEGIAMACQPGHRTSEREIVRESHCVLGQALAPSPVHTPFGTCGPPVWPLRMQSRGREGADPTGPVSPLSSARHGVEERVTRRVTHPSTAPSRRDMNHRFNTRPVSA